MTDSSQYIDLWAAVIRQAMLDLEPQYYYDKNDREKQIRDAKAFLASKDLQLICEMCGVEVGKVISGVR